jgi:hypothetical protein
MSVQLIGFYEKVDHFIPLFFTVPGYEKNGSIQDGIAVAGGRG